MRAEQEKLNSRLNGMNEEEKDLLIRRLLEENSEMEARLEIANSAAAELAVQYQQIKDENAALKEEKKELLKEYLDYEHKNWKTYDATVLNFNHSAPLLQPPSKQQSTLTAPKIPADIRLAENGRRISIPFRQGRSMTSMLMP